MDDASLLNKKIEVALNTLDTTNNYEEKYFLMDYLSNLYSSLFLINGIKFGGKNIFGSPSNYELYCQKEKEYNDKLLENYILHQTFHKNYFNSVLEEIKEDYKRIPPLSDSLSSLSRKDFWDIFFLYLKEIHLDHFFDFLSQNKSIHFIENSSDKGYALYNPLTKDIDLFVNNFDYNISNMRVLVHELGHAYDFSKLEGKVEEYNHYYSLSFYPEVLSMTLERSFLHFLLENKIEKSSAKQEMISFEEISHTILLGSSIWSLFDDDFLTVERMQKTKEKVLMEKVKENFSEDINLKQLFSRLKLYNLSDIHKYAYGDILSMFLSEEMEKSGFSNELMRDFLANRNTIFSEEFIEKENFTPKEYTKLYKKEINLLKK